MTPAQHRHPNQRARDQKNHPAAGGGFEQQGVGAHSQHSGGEGENNGAFLHPSSPNDAQRKNRTGHKKCRRVVAVREKSKIRRGKNALGKKGIFPAGFFGVDRESGVDRAAERADEGDVNFYPRTHRMP